MKKYFFLLALPIMVMILNVPKTTVFASTDVNSIKIEKAISCDYVSDSDKQYYQAHSDSILQTLGIAKYSGGHQINVSTLTTYCMAVYGDPWNPSGYSNMPGPNGRTEKRFLGYTAKGVKLPNPYYPDDTSHDSTYTQGTPFESFFTNSTTINSTDKSRINRGTKPPLVYGDPRWTSAGQVNYNDAYRIDKLGAAVDVPYIEKSGSLTTPQGYIRSRFLTWNSTDKSYDGTYLTKYANVLAYQTKYVSGSFAMYNWKDPTMWYHSYILPSEESPFDMPPDFSIGTGATDITWSPLNPLPGDNVTFTVKIKNDADPAGTGYGTRTYNHVGLKFGWTDPTSNNFWCYNGTDYTSDTPDGGVTLAPGWNTFTFNSTNTQKCDGSTGTFKYPAEGGKQVFYVNINYLQEDIKHGGVREYNKMYANNLQQKNVEGKYQLNDHDSAINTFCPDGSIMCITHYPQFPSTKTEGGENSYFDGKFRFLQQGTGDSRLLPKSVLFTTTLKDPKDTIMSPYNNLVRTTTYNISSCAPSTGLDITSNASYCKVYNFFIGDNWYSAIPTDSHKLIFNNPGKFNLDVKAVEKFVYRWKRTTCNNNVPSTCTTTILQQDYPFDLTVEAKDVDYVTGISTGVGND